MQSLLARILVVVLLACGVVPAAQAGHPIWDATGFNPNRASFSQLPYEHIDSMTGNLLLTFTDLELPGNAGFNLRIQRTFNSKALHQDYQTAVYAPGEDSWAGSGWILHLGRVFVDNVDNPIVEMPDGTRHEFYPHIRPSACMSSSCYVSKEYWVYDRIYHLLKLPNGTVYSFGAPVFRELVPGNRARYATRIEDPFGNRISITYRTSPSDAINTVVQDLGSQTRTITFSTNATSQALASMTYGTSTWTYTQVLPPGSSWSAHRWLTQVTAPEGLSWRFAHDPATGEITSVTTPLGGNIQYTYGEQQFRLGHTGVGGETRSRAVIGRATGGRDVPGGTWSYRYAAGLDANQTVIVSPCKTTTYIFLGVGLQSGSEAPWRVGLQASSVVTVDSTVLERTTTQWRASDRISDQGAMIGPRIDPDTYVPLVESQTVSRGGIDYVTTHSYRSDSSAQTLNDYGRPYRTDEDGQLGRRITREFEYGFSGYIVDKLRSESVQKLNSGFPTGPVFRTDYDYSSSTGFLTRKTVYGVATSFTPDGRGNVDSVTDGEGKATRFTYDWGVPKTVTTAEYGSPVITRSINANGTIASEGRLKDGSYKTTSFAYDLLFRPTRVTPPLGNLTTTTYIRDGSGFLTRTESTRGAVTVRTDLDGFGRVSATANLASGVATDLAYDACDRKIYESYPYTAANIGSTYVYDGLGRVLEKRDPPGQSGGQVPKVTYAYASNRVTITNEEGRDTVQTWSAAGDPAAALLSSVREANGHTTQYEYDVLGNLTRVNPPSGGERTWTYNAKGQLEREKQPENDGDVSYTYYSNGLLRTRTDGLGRATFYYDRMNRLERVDRPGTAYDTVIAQDESDNRILVRNGHVRSDFTYDNVNRLLSRTDAFAGQQFATSYTYDANDNLKTITYPYGTTRKVDYDYDSANRIIQVDNAAAAPVAYATAFQYHPSGAVTSYRAGNGLTHSATYDQRYRVDTLNAGGLLQLDYGYDRIGNVTSIDDVRPGMNQSFIYDTVDRLITANGPWGGGNFDYDPVGNRRSKQIGNAYTSYDYGTGNRLRFASGTEADSFSYDSNGNLKKTNTATYSYTPENQMEVAVVAGRSTTYRYDADNLRKVKIETDGTQRYYVHGPGNQILTEFSRSPGGPLTIVRDYVYAGTRLIASVKPPVLTVTPDELAYVVVRNGPMAASQPIQISTVNENGVSWTASDNATWVTLSATSGTTPATVNVSVNHTGLPTGFYTAAITINAPGAVGSPQQILVMLDVLEREELVVRPTSLRVDHIQGQSNPAPRSIHILYPYVSVPWRSTVSAPWLHLAPPSGVTQSRPTVSVTAEQLTSGTYQGAITVHADGYQGSPKTVIVQLAVQPPAGATCAPDAWYCETFDELMRGDIHGQGGWQAFELNSSAQVEADPRGIGHALLLDPQPNQMTNDYVDLDGRPINGNEISMHVRLGDLPADLKNVAKIEFFTNGGGFGATRRTFGTVRMAGGVIYLQYGPNIYKRIVSNAESNRFYDVKIRHRNNRVDAIVDGTPRFSTTSFVPGTQPFQALVTSSWDLPGSAWLDLLQIRSLSTTPQPDLFVDPLVLNFYGPRVASNEATKPPAHASAAGATETAYGQLPMVFEPNLGQAAADASYVARGAGYAIALKEAGVDLRLASEGSLGLRLLDAARSRPVGEDAQTGKSHYLLGSDPSKWKKDIPHYGRVRYGQIYPGIDAVFYGNQRQLEYDFEVSPGADPAAIRLSFDGAKSLRIDDAGDLVLSMPSGDVRQHKPVAYQPSPDGRDPVDAAYVIAEDKTVFVRVAAYDPERPLVIDPVLTYSTKLGGGGTDQATAITVDSQGFAYVAGTTSSSDFPVETTIQPVKDGSSYADAFITKLNREGTAIVYSTYLGGTSVDTPHDLAVDADGILFVVGTTSSNDFPTTAHNALLPIDPTVLPDGFLTSLAADGSELRFSTYIGDASAYEGTSGTGVKLHAGEVYVSGRSDFSHLAGMPATLVNLDQTGIAASPFVARFSYDGRTIGALVVLNGPYHVQAYVPMAVGDDGAVYIAGKTVYWGVYADRARNPFPASPNGWFAPSIPTSGNEIFVTKLAPTSLGLVYSSWFGSGSHQEAVSGIAVDPSGSAYVSGDTTAPVAGSTDFPTTPGAIWATHSGSGTNAFLVKLLPNGSGAEYATYLGRPASGQWVRAYGVAVDFSGRAYVAGQSQWTSFPDDKCASKANYGGTSATAMLLRINPTGTVLEECTFIGPNGTARDVDVDSTGAIYMAGDNAGVSFHTTPGAFQSTGTSEAFIAKFSGVPAPFNGLLQLSSPTYSVNESGRCVTLTVTRTGSTSGTVGVTYSTQDHTADSLDYVSVADVLTLHSGDPSATFSVPILDDATVEGTETLTVALSGPTGGAGLGAQRTAIVYIEDNDQAQPLSATFVVRDRYLGSGPPWSASASVPWVTLSAMSGTGPSTVTVTANPAGLAPGSYSGWINVFAPGAIGSPQSILVNLVVMP